MARAERNASESPQGTACTTRTESYEDQCKENAPDAVQRAIDPRAVVRADVADVGERARDVIVRQRRVAQRDVRAAEARERDAAEVEDDLDELELLRVREQRGRDRGREEVYELLELRRGRRRRERGRRRRAGVGVGGGVEERARGGEEGAGEVSRERYVRGRRESVAAAVAAWTSTRTVEAE